VWKRSNTSIHALVRLVRRDAPDEEHVDLAALAEAAHRRRIGTDAARLQRLDDRRHEPRPLRPAAEAGERIEVEGGRRDPRRNQLEQARELSEARARQVVRGAVGGEERRRA
jgi:hypothetical protein